MPVKTSTATVFHGGGRRWFSRKTAERAEAMSIIRRRCDCYRGSTHDLGDDPDEPCKWHWMGISEPKKFQRLVHLLIVMFVRRGEQPTSAQRPARKRGSKYPFLTMEVGEDFLVIDRYHLDFAAYCRVFVKRTGISRKFSCRAEGNNVRVRRVA